MKIQRPRHLAALTVIALPVAFVLATSSTVFAKDTHGHHDESTKKIVAPAAATPTPQEGGPAIPAPIVKTEPAPGTNGHLEGAPAAGHGHGGHDATPGVSAEQSLKWLQNGNTRYVNKSFRKDGRSQDDRTRLMAGQHPHAIVLSCADSRVPAEMVFDQALGEIFVIRVAGEALDSSVIASVEYAVEHLGPRLLVVMGHTKCGAVDTALKVKEGDSAGSESLDKLLADIRPRLKTVMSEPRSPNLETESALNADGIARDLVKRSEIVRKKVESGELTIKSSLYRIDTGKVTFY